MDMKGKVNVSITIEAQFDCDDVANVKSDDYVHEALHKRYIVDYYVEALNVEGDSIRMDSGILFR